jgi:hypothetical protein
MVRWKNLLNAAGDMFTSPAASPSVIGRWYSDCRAGGAGVATLFERVDDG